LPRRAACSCRTAARGASQVAHPGRQKGSRRRRHHDAKRHHEAHWQCVSGRERSREGESARERHAEEAAVQRENLVVRALNKRALRGLQVELVERRLLRGSRNDTTSHEAVSHHKSRSRVTTLSHTPRDPPPLPTVAPTRVPTVHSLPPSSRSPPSSR